MPIEAPTLTGLLGELKQLEKAGHLQKVSSPIQGGGRFTFDRGRDVARLDWPGVGSYWLDKPQQEIVAVLLDAHLNCSNPEVRTDTLLRAAGVTGKKLSEVFADHEAWGTLIVPGKVVGGVRLADPVGGPIEADDEEERSVPDEWSD